MQNHFSNPFTGLQRTLPNSTGVLVLGILSIVLFCCCYGVVGAILAIVALAMAKKANNLYLFSPDEYSISSLKNMNAGKICAIIGLSISGIYFVFCLVILAFYGFVFSKLLSPTFFDKF